MQRSLKRAALLLLIPFWPGLAPAETGGGVGVVTTLSGQATVARASLPQPLPLKFKDDVFVRDRISTGENSVVRVLLGGKALITARELSVLTITEEMGRSTVDLEAGKVAVGVVRKKMKPGELIEIRTPNAVAAVRGTVLVVEIVGTPKGSGVPVISNFHVLKGAIDVYLTSASDVAPVRVATMQSLSASGSTLGSLRPLTPEGVKALTVDLKARPKEHAEVPTTMKEELAQQQQAKAEALALALAPEPSSPSRADRSGNASKNSDPNATSGSSGATAEAAGAVAETTATVSDTGTASTTSTTTAGTPPAALGPATGASGVIASSAPGAAATTTAPTGTLVQAPIVPQLLLPPQAPPPPPTALFRCSSGNCNFPGDFNFKVDDDDVSLAQPLLAVTNTNLKSTGEVLLIDEGALVGTDASPLLSFSGSSLDTNHIAYVKEDGTLTLAGPLFLATDSTITNIKKFVEVSDGGRFSSSATAPLFSLSNTDFSGADTLFDLSGSATALDLTTLLTLATDRPLRHDGTLFEASGGTLSTKRVLKVDKALLEASAPILSLKNGSRLTASEEALELSNKSKVTSLGELVRLDASTLTASKAAIKLDGGSLLTVTGNLFSLSNGSTLSVLNGPLLEVTGGSFVNISGALVLFGGTGGNIINITNNLCPCTPISGIPVSLKGGALPINVTLGPTLIKNPALGSINLSPNAAVIVVDGVTTRVTIQGQ